MEEQVRGHEDMRGVEAFIAWCTGPTALEIRRIAGMLPETGNQIINLSTANAKGGAGGGGQETLLAVERPEDFLTVLKKKHAKTKDGEESRWAGTVLGREKEKERGEGRGVRIEGWEGMEELGDWAERFRRRESRLEGVDTEMEVGTGNDDDDDGVKGGGTGSGSSSPLSEISAVTAT